jgi:AAA domain, putative AbiEii toxin, Type IV TA system
VIAGVNGVGKSRLLEYLCGQASGWQDGNPASTALYVRTDRNLKDGAAPAIQMFRTVYFTGDSNAGLSPVSSHTSQHFKQWFVQMDNAVHRGWLDTTSSEANFNLAKSVFGMLDPRVSFLKVDRDFKIIVQTPNGAIPLEQLSSGFQSSYLILLGIIFAIDKRSYGQFNARDFAGCILIDEIDAHLHPSWQGEIFRHIEQIVPKAQIIVTTHSPHIIQGLRENELIVLEVGTDGLSRIRPVSPVPGPYGFQGWTIEEILTDVFGLKTTISAQFSSVEAKFNAALDADDYAVALQAYTQLDQMLHPRSPFRKIYQLQLESIREDGE